jgi:hypothetical protein
MRTKVMLAVIIVFQLISCQKGCDLTNLNFLSREYEYPIIPGTEEWGKLKSNKEKLDALQIPMCIMDIISDSGLVKTCLNYPRYLDYTAFNDPVTGFDHMINDFNGYQIILGDKRYYHFIVLYYLKKDALKWHSEWEPLEYISYHGPIFAHELMLSKQYLIESISDNDRMALFEKAFKNLDTKMDKSTFGPFSYSNCAYLLAKLMSYYGYQLFLNLVASDPTLANFLGTAETPDPYDFELIRSSAFTFLKETEK